MYRRILGLLALLLAWACLTAVNLPDTKPGPRQRHFHPAMGAEPWTPLLDYPGIFHDAEYCVGIYADYAKIVWRVRPGNNFSTDDGTAVGYWEAPDTIILAKEWATTTWVVKHEILHYILQAGHSPFTEYWVWGFLCHATWDFVPKDPAYKP